MIKTGQKYRFNPEKYASYRGKTTQKPYIITAITNGSPSEHGWFIALQEGEKESGLFNIAWFDLII